LQQEWNLPSFLTPNFAEDEDYIRRRAERDTPDWLRMLS
jgi:hypothetical protein